MSNGEPFFFVFFFATSSRSRCNGSKPNLHHCYPMHNFEDVEYYHGGKSRPVHSCFTDSPLAVLETILISSHLSRSLADRWGTTVDFTTSFLHSSRFSAFRSSIVHSRPVHSDIVFPSFPLSASFVSLIELFPVG